MKTRTFDDKSAVRERVPLLLGLVGPSSSGKTFSALRLATGMQRVIGGEIFFIDTEAKRGTHYADRFAFRHIDFQPPFGPLDYLAAIEHCVKQGAKVLVIDSLTHEHSGPGGVMDQSEDYLQKHCGDDFGKRQRQLMLSLVRPKQQRKRLNAEIVRLGINAIFCYRATDKIKPMVGKEPEKLGWQPETTSPLHYEMTQRFLLTPGCDGVPSLSPENDAEKRMVKNPAQFRDLFKAGQALSEDIGQKLAEWASGAKPEKPAGNGDMGQAAAAKTLLADYPACGTQEAFEVLEKARGELWKSLSPQTQKKVKEASEAAKVRLAELRFAASEGTSESEDDGIGEPPASLFGNETGEAPKH